MTNITISTLINDIVIDMSIDRLKRIWGDSLIRKAIRLALKELQSRGFYSLEFNNGDTSINSVIGQNNYSIGTNFTGLEDVDKVYFNGVELNPTTKQEVIDIGGEASTGNPSNFYLYNDDICLYPIPDSVKTIRVIYKKVITITDNDTEIVIDYDKYNDFLVFYAGYHLFLSKADPLNQQRALGKKALWEPLIRKIIIAYGIRNKEEELKYKSNYRSRLYSNNYQKR